MANSLIEDVLNEPVKNVGSNNDGKNPKKKKSKFGIFIIILLLIIIICLAVYIFLQAKNAVVEVSSKEGFFNTVTSSNIEEIGTLDSYEEFMSKIISENSSAKSTISMDYSTEDFSINNIILSLDSATDIENSKFYTDAILSYSDNDIFELELLATDEAIALKSDEIVTSYIGLKYEYILENLISGMLTSSYADDYDYSYDYYDYYTLDDVAYVTNETNNETGNIIENITIEDLEEIKELTMSEESIEIYANILNENLDDSHFSSKEVELQMDSGTVDAIEYTLTMTEEEMVNIVEEILIAFETDTETIETLSSLLEILGITEDDLINSVDDMIESLEEYEIDETEEFIIKAYDSDGKTVKVSCQYSGVTMEIEYEYGDNQNSMKITAIDDETDGGLSIKFTNSKSDLSEEFVMELSIIEDSLITQTCDVSTSLIKSGNSYKLAGGVVYSDSADSSITLDLNSEIKFVDVDIDDLTSENCVYIDELTDEERESLLNGIYEQATTVLSEKMSALSFIDTNSSSGIIQQGEDGGTSNEKEEAMDALVEEIQNEMTEAYNNGEDFTIQDLEGIQIEGYTVETEISSDLAVITVDGYVFNIDSDFNLSD